MKWSLKQFSELSNDELYALLKLRSIVFVVEQQCVFLDMDDKDQEAHHLMAWDNNELIAYTRLVSPGISYELPSIGRVVTAEAARGRGLGRVLMEKSIEAAIQLYGKGPIKIGAQLYLEAFYTSLGFKRSSDVYLEDGIEHIEMIYND